MPQVDNKERNIDNSQDLVIAEGQKAVNPPEAVHTEPRPEGEAVERWELNSFKKRLNWYTTQSNNATNIGQLANMMLSPLRNQFEDLPEIKVLIESLRDLYSDAKEIEQTGANDSRKQQTELINEKFRSKALSVFGTLSRIIDENPLHPGWRRLLDRCAKVPDFMDEMSADVDDINTNADVDVKRATNTFGEALDKLFDEEDRYITVFPVEEEIAKNVESVKEQQVLSMVVAFWKASQAARPEAAERINVNVDRPPIPKKEEMDALSNPEARKAYIGDIREWCKSVIGKGLVNPKEFADKCKEFTLDVVNKRNRLNVILGGLTDAINSDRLSPKYKKEMLLSLAMYYGNGSGDPMKLSDDKEALTGWVKKVGGIISSDSNLAGDDRWFKALSDKVVEIKDSADEAIERSEKLEKLKALNDILKDHSTWRDSGEFKTLKGRIDTVLSRNDGMPPSKDDIEGIRSAARDYISRKIDQKKSKYSPAESERLGAVLEIYQIAYGSDLNLNDFSEELGMRMDEKQGVTFGRKNGREHITFNEFENLMKKNRERMDKKTADIKAKRESRKSAGRSKQADQVLRV